ncbi:MAG: hypothetical protein L3V56_10200 [Candidatus Magnetoovum sp. WYHC-5]|nr:hypothetical protein [Candidatus Magnetoovum sp. WYHC-5]
MNYDIKKVKVTVSNILRQQLTDELTIAEVNDGLTGQSVEKFRRDKFIKNLIKTYLNLLGIISIGVGTGLLAVMFSYIVFVMLMHIEF